MEKIKVIKPQTLMCGEMPDISRQFAILEVVNNVKRGKFISGDYWPFRLYGNRIELFGESKARELLTGDLLRYPDYNGVVDFCDRAIVFLSEAYGALMGAFDHFGYPNTLEKDIENLKEIQHAALRLVFDRYSAVDFGELYYIFHSEKNTDLTRRSMGSLDNNGFSRLEDALWDEFNDGYRDDNIVLGKILVLAGPLAHMYGSLINLDLIDYCDAQIKFLQRAFEEPCIFGPKAARSFRSLVDFV